MPTNQGAIPMAAAFRVQEGQALAKITVMSLEGAGGGELANVSRWREQVNGPPIKDEQELQRIVRPLTVAGKKAISVDLVSSAKEGGQESKRILGVIIPLRDQTWFVKMMGPAPLVEKQKKAFDQFVQSLQLDGGSDG